MTALCDLIFLSAKYHADWAHVAQFLYLAFENAGDFMKCTILKVTKLG